MKTAEQQFINAMARDMLLIALGSFVAGVVVAVLVQAVFS